MSYCIDLKTDYCPGFMHIMRYISKYKTLRGLGSLKKSGIWGNIFGNSAKRLQEMYRMYVSQNQSAIDSCPSFAALPVQ